MKQMKMQHAKRLALFLFISVGLVWGQSDGGQRSGSAASVASTSGSAALARLNKYVGFTDIEFNPSKSINCQARSCALFVSLMKHQILQNAVSSPEAFIRLGSQFDYRPNLKTNDHQGAFF
jgi:hypothetical protein